jgi:hypothetical protein
MLLHDRQVHGDTCTHLSAPHHNLFCAPGRGPVNSQDLIDNTEQSDECGLDGIPPICRDVAVEDFLQYFGIAEEALPIADQVIQQTLCIGLVRMSSSNQVHRDVRVG